MQQINENFIPNFEIIRKLEGYVYPIGMQLVDWIILRSRLSKIHGAATQDLPRPDIHPQLNAGVA